MTREEFIKVLEEKGYSYKIEGDKIVVTGGIYSGSVYLESLETLPPGVEFKNVVGVFLASLIGGGGWFSGWSGNIKGIDSNRLLNLMISKGLFI